MDDFPSIFKYGRKKNKFSYYDSNSTLNLTNCSIVASWPYPAARFKGLLISPNFFESWDVW